MKYLLCFTLLLHALVAEAQFGIVTTIAGTGTEGYTGDGGPAYAAQLNRPKFVAIDRFKNVYFAQEDDHVIRKITPLGIISTVAGDGTPGFGGDGGPATAAKLHYPRGIVVDDTGNIYIADIFNYRVRKINTLGIITTIAGNGINGFSGDGGPAIAAALQGVYSIAIGPGGYVYIACATRIRKVSPSGVITTIAGSTPYGYSGDGGPATAAKFGIAIYDLFFDRAGNLYVPDFGNNRVRKINTAGIVTTIAGSGIEGFSGDGGPATSATLHDPYGVTVDKAGNVYISEGANRCVRKVNTEGIISTVIGTGTVFGYGGDGGPATAALFASIMSVRMDNTGSIYIADCQNNRVRKFTPSTSIASDSFVVYVSKYCGGLQFHVSTNSYVPGHHVKTYFGGGVVLDTVTSLSAGVGAVNFSRPYYSSGQYTIKHVLYNGATAIDSATYSHEYTSCENMRVSFYYDANSNCVKDSSEHLTSLPVTAEIDSNGIAIDTISATSGLFYTTKGNPSDIYTFRILTTPPGLNPTCLSPGGIFTDTLGSSAGSKKYVGFSCGSAAGFNLGEYVTSIAGRHMQSIDAVVYNTHCTPQTATVTMKFSPDYVFASAQPTPLSVVGNTITWSVANVSSIMAASTHLHATLTVPGPWLTPGDTVVTKCITGPIIGDIDTNNNQVIRIDTVKGAWDPNEISVEPSGNILPGMRLQYTINFENTGNDTAFNIYIMDTLSDDVDIHSLRVVAASASMITSKYYDTTIHHNIVKFEFPNINLLDSSHHDECHGFAVFNIRTKNNLADNTPIYNHAGIFFDYNPVVLTNTVENRIRLIAGPSSVCVGSNITLTDAVNNGVWTCSNSHATILGGIVTGVSAGIDTIFYTVTNQFGTVSTSKVVTINPLPVAGTITGIAVVCVASTTTLTDTTVGGVWSSSATTTATVSSAGTVSGLLAGTVTISYSVTNGCATASATRIVTVNPLPNAGVISGVPTVCVFAATVLTDIVTGGVWSSSSAGIAAIGSTGVVAGISAGTSTISYSVTNSCGTATTTQPVTVNPLPIAGTIAGPDNVCEGSTITLTDAATGGAWSSGSAGVATISGTGVVTGVSSGISIISYIVTNTCGTATTTQSVTVNPLPIAGTISGADTVCEGSSVTLTDIIPGGAWSSSSIGAAIVDPSSGIVTGIAMGTSAITYSVTNSCGTANAIKVINVNPFPNAGTIIGSDTVCIGSVIALSNTTIGGSWGGSNANSLVSGDGSVYGITSGFDTVIYTFSNSCGTSSVEKIIQIIDCPTEVNNTTNSNKDIALYPNPTQNAITIASSGGIKNVVITNIIGQKVFSETYDKIEVVIGLNLLPGGVYIVKVNDCIVYKVFKQ